MQEEKLVKQANRLHVEIESSDLSCHVEINRHAGPIFSLVEWQLHQPWRGERGRGEERGEVNLSTANVELSALTCLKRGCAT